MTSTEVNVDQEIEQQEGSLSSLHVDSKNLLRSELNNPTSTATSTEGTQEHIVELCRSQPQAESLHPDFSTLSATQGAVLRTTQTTKERSTSVQAREAALHARLQRLQERPNFVAQVRASSARNKSNQLKPLGLFKNPFYKYRGGILNRIITFLANVLKMLESLLLRRLNPAKNQNKQVVIIQPPLAEATKAERKRKEELKERERKRMTIPGPPRGGRM